MKKRYVLGALAILAGIISIGATSSFWVVDENGARLPFGTSGTITFPNISGTTNNINVLTDPALDTHIADPNIHPTPLPLFTPGSVVFAGEDGLAESPNFTYNELGLNVTNNIDDGSDHTVASFNGAYGSVTFKSDTRPSNLSRTLMTIMSEPSVTSVYPIFSASYRGKSFGNFGFTTSGRLLWGNSDENFDTNLYRYSAGVLKTDTDIHAASIRSGGLMVGSESNPFRAMEVIDAGANQIRLSQTIGVAFTDAGTDSSGIFHISPSGGAINIDDSTLYLAGDADTDGSWRVSATTAGDYIVESRIGGVWTVKQTIAYNPTPTPTATPSGASGVFQSADGYYISVENGIITIIDTVPPPVPPTDTPTPTPTETPTPTP